MSSSDSMASPSVRFALGAAAGAEGVEDGGAAGWFVSDPKMSSSAPYSCPGPKMSSSALAADVGELARDPAATAGPGSGEAAALEIFAGAQPLQNTRLEFRSSSA
jgi:hypothetical protein